MTNSRIGFRNLPLELRNEIYQYVIGDIRQLKIPSASWVGTRHGPHRLLFRRIPPSLLLNRQIANEAVQVSLQRVKSIKACNPRDIANVFPADTLLPNVRHLEFTVAQPFYTGIERSACSSPHDVASRCPRLEELRLLFPATNPTMNNFASDLISIFENKRLVKLHLGYRDAPSKGWDVDVALFRPLESWFLRECRERKKHIKLTIDLSPGRVPGCYEERRIQVGNFTYIHGFDMFG